MISFVFRVAVYRLHLDFAAAFVEEKPHARLLLRVHGGNSCARNKNLLTELRNYSCQKALVYYSFIKALLKLFKARRVENLRESCMQI